MVLKGNPIYTTKVVVEVPVDAQRKAARKTEMELIGYERSCPRRRKTLLSKDMPRLNGVTGRWCALVKPIVLTRYGRVGIHTGHISDRKSVFKTAWGALISDKILYSNIIILFLLIALRGRSNITSAYFRLF